MNVFSNHRHLTHRRLRPPVDLRPETALPRPALYTLTLVLAGLTAEDYLQWIRDPDPPARANLRLMSVRAVPPGERIELELLAQGQLPALQAAVTAVGFPITPEVIGIHMACSGTSNGLRECPDALRGPAL